MTLHVDVVVNDLSGRTHRCVAALHLVDHGKAIKVEVLDEAYRRRIPLCVWDAEARADVTRQSDPLRYLQLLQHEIDGVRLYATQPHEARLCMFTTNAVVPMSANTEVTTSA